MGFEWDKVDPQFSQIYSVIADDNITSFASWIFIILLHVVYLESLYNELIS